MIIKAGDHVTLSPTVETGTPERYSHGVVTQVGPYVIDVLWDGYDGPQSMWPQHLSREEGQNV